VAAGPGRQAGWPDPIGGGVRLDRPGRTGPTAFLRRTSTVGTSPVGGASARGGGCSPPGARARGSAPRQGRTSARAHGTQHLFYPGHGRTIQARRRAAMASWPRVMRQYPGDQQPPVGGVLGEIHCA
jgi:hypothetical protein